MLTKKDKAAIQDLIREELSLALNRKITVERGPRQQGDPEKVIKEEDWNILDFLAIYLPRIEGSMRGMQEDLDKAKCDISIGNERIGAIGNILIGMENAAKQLAEFSDNIKMIKSRTQNTLALHNDAIMESESVIEGDKGNVSNP